MIRSAGDVVDENRLDYLHSMTKIILTVDLPRLNFGGKTYENLQKGNVLNVWHWVAETLVSNGYAEYASKPSLANQLMQVEWREKNNPLELQPLPKHFYPETSEAVVLDEYLEKKLHDIITMRMMKIVSLAAKRLDGDIAPRTTPEEEFLYRKVFNIVDEWMKTVSPKRGEK